LPCCIHFIEQPTLVCIFVNSRTVFTIQGNSSMLFVRETLQVVLCGTAAIVFR